MNIDLLARMVKEVVMDHDTVTLPGVGSFVTELVPATFADRGYTILPPYRRLYFSPTQGEDTLLVDLYAQANHIPIADAERILADFLTEMKEVLKVKKTIVFPGLGRLRATRENHFFFVADEDLDIYPTGFGLQPISLKTHEETKEEVEEAVSALASILEKEPEPAEAPVIPTEVEESPELEPAEGDFSTPPTAPLEMTKEEEPAPVIPTEAEESPEPEPEPAPVIPTEPAPVIPTEPAPVIPTEVEESPEPEEMADQVGHDVEPEPAPTNKGKKIVLWTLIALCILLLVAGIALAVVGRVAPEWLDSFLYSPEELEVLYK